MLQGANRFEGYLRAVPVSRIAMLANITLILLLAHTLAGLTWSFIQGGEGASVPLAVTLDTRAESAANKPPSLQKLAGMHLLGEAGRAAEVEQSEPIDAPETRLNLELKGLFAVDRPEVAMAIIAASGKDEMSYRVGQNVAGAATVHQILPDRVILKRGDRFETLTLPKDRIPGVDGSNSQAGVNSSAGRGAVSSRGTAVRPLPGLRQRIMSDPQQALSLVQAQPVMENGQLQGYRVNPGDERELFARAGLRPGDVVTQVNGLPLSDPSQLGELMQQFTSSPRVDVTVERAGRPVTLTLDLQ